MKDENDRSPLEFLSGRLGGTTDLAQDGDEETLIRVVAPQDSPPVAVGIQMWSEQQALATGLNDSRCVLDLVWGTAQGESRATVDVIRGGTFVLCGNVIEATARYQIGRTGVGGSYRVSASLMPQTPAAGSYPSPTLQTDRWVPAVGSSTGLFPVPGFARRVTALHAQENAIAVPPQQLTVIQYVAAGGATLSQTEVVRANWVPILGSCESIRVKNSAGPVVPQAVWAIWEMAF